MRLQKTDGANVYSTFMCCTTEYSSYIHSIRQDAVYLWTEHKEDQHSGVVSLKVTRLMKLESGTFVTQWSIHQQNIQYYSR